jgi:hypothetical protein
MYVISLGIVLTLGYKDNAASGGWKSTSDSTAQHHVTFRHKPSSYREKPVEQVYSITER